MIPPAISKAASALIRKFRSITERQWKIAGLVFLALLAAGPIWFLIYDLIGQKAWKDYEAAVRAQGERLHLADITQPPIPDAENFGALPLFKNTLNLNQRLPSFPKRDHPPFASAQTGIRFEEDRWRTYFAKAGWIDTPSNDVASDLRLALLPYHDAVEEVTEGLKRPHCVFGIAWMPNPYAAPLSYLHVLVPLIKVVTLQANAHLVGGDSEAALEDLRLLAGIRDRLAAAGGDYTSNLRISIARHQAAIIYEGLARRAWSERQLRDIIAILNAVDPLKDMADWLEMERAITNGWFDWILAGNVPAPTKLADYKPERWLQNVKVLRTFPGIVRRNQLQVAKCYTRMRKKIDFTAGTYTGGNLRPDVDDLPYYWLADFSLGTLDDMRRSYLVHVARTRLALIACALELYRERHQIYPENLADLVPSCLPVLPHEPTGKDDFIYYATDDGKYRLYSRGPNGEDERGFISRYKVGENYLRAYRDSEMIDVPWTAPPPR